MKLKIELELDDFAEEAMRDTLVQSHLVEHVTKPEDASQADIEDYMADRNVELVASYIQGYRQRRSAEAAPDAVARKAKIDVAPPDIKAQIDELLKNVDPDAGSVTPA